MKIGILKETKTPVDNRVALTPSQIAALKQKYPDTIFKVQTSDTRAFSNQEYRDLGIDVVESVDDCDLIMGIKEADIATLKPHRHYLFFGHIAKMQEYNIPLFKTLVDNEITFSDYEYLVDEDNCRLVAFGWYAGIVGVYYTLRGWGIRTGEYTLPKPTIKSTVDELVTNVRKANPCNIKLLITGNGRVSQGAQHFLTKIGAHKLSTYDYLKQPSATDGITYCVATHEDLVAPNSLEATFDKLEFNTYPERYHETFSRFAEATDILVSCHFWDNRQPVYLSKESFLSPDFKIKMIGDVTCDIQGSIKSTLRSSTHDDPFYDYNPVTQSEEPAFSSPSNVTVMAVDTCPNALPRETSQYFGQQLIEHVLDDALQHGLDRSDVLQRATILNAGALTSRFNYLEDYVSTFTD